MIVAMKVGASHAECQLLPRNPAPMRDGRNSSLDASKDAEPLTVVRVTNVGIAVAR